MKQLTKRIIIIVLALSMLSCVFAFSACSKTNGCQASRWKYIRVDAEGVESKDGEYLLFGSYPQTDVTNELGLELKEFAGELPTKDDSKDWTSYRYYKGIEGENKATNAENFMWHKDIEYQKERYKAVYFVDYRPYYTATPSAKEYSEQPSNGFTSRKIYWFKYEPIKWRILKEENGTALLLCENIIDSQAYQNDYYNDDGKYYVNNGEEQKTYANNYEQSSIRAWLNDNFYNTAFNKKQKELVVAYNVDNGSSTTSNAQNVYACNHTNDNVFLLSYKDMLNAEYGFEVQDGISKTRERKNTDYAKVQGGYNYVLTDEYKGNGYWRLRSSSADDSNCAHYVYMDGGVDSVGDVNNTSIGIVPALQIKF